MQRLNDICIIFVVMEHEDEHLGLMYLSSLLKSKGYIPEIMPADYTAIRTRLVAYRNKKVILGYSTTSFSSVKYLELNSRLKSEFSFFSIFGGYYPTSYPELIEQDGVDAVCIGEGEYAFLELIEKIADNIDISAIPNLWVKVDNRITKNSVRPALKDLDSLPYPDRELFLRKSKYFHGRIYLATSRGCFYSCPHCYNSTYRKLYGNQYRRRSVDNLIREIKEIRKKQDVKFIFFYDDIFTVMPEWLNEFSDKYSREVGIPFRCNARFDTISEEILKSLKKANCRVISLGIETANDSILKNILLRNMNTKDIKEKCRMVKKHGIKLRTTNMIGLPDGSLAVDLDTLKFNIECKVDYAMVSLFRVYPRTDFASQTVRYTRDYSMGNEPGGHFSEFHQHLKNGFVKRLPSSDYQPVFGYTNEEEKNMIANLHELFSFIVNFPFLFPLVKFLIRLPLKRFYVYINYFWSYIACSYIMYPTGRITNNKHLKH